MQDWQVSIDKIPWGWGVWLKRIIIMKTQLIHKFDDIISLENLLLILSMLKHCQGYKVEKMIVAICETPAS